jgi:hypothetical protein
MAVQPGCARSEIPGWGLPQDGARDKRIIIIDSELLNMPACVPWWNGATLRMVT